MPAARQSVRRVSGACSRIFNLHGRSVPDLPHLPYPPHPPCMIDPIMQIARPAILKPDVTLDNLPGPRPSDTPQETTGRLVRGKALIFWDPRQAGKKLDAIDTDQITPAADCVSESLDTLDERWKAGSFRYLMPDFRARVHGGATFVIAGDRFAIGSSREMSPAGLKAIAEEVGREMVIICGQNMGDIFRRNAFNLGLHVVQSPEAVADARDDDEFTFNPATRQIANVTQGKTYDPVPLTAKEDEIRRSGGIFAIGRREFRSSVERTPRDRVSRSVARAAHVDDRADHLGAPCRQGRRGQAGRDASRLCRPAARLGRHGAVFDPHLQSDYRRQHDRSAAGGRRQRSLRLHRQGRTTTSRQRSGGSSPRSTGSRSRTTPRPATASSTSIFRSRAWSSRGSSFLAPTRTRAPMAPMGPSASASARRRSALDGRRATSTSRWPSSAACDSRAGCGRG